MQRGFLFGIFLQAQRDRPEFRPRAGLGDFHQPPAGDHGGAHEHFIVIGFDAFGNGFAFPGQDGFVDGKLVALDHHPVPGDVFAHVQQHDVLGNQFPDFHLLPSPFADDGGGGFKQSLKGRVGPFGLVFLNEAQDHVDHDDGHDDPEIAQLADQQRNQRGGQDDVDQGAFYLGQQDRPARNPLLGREPVFAELLPAFQGFGGG